MKKDKLYKVNKYNRPAFMPKAENLFFTGGPENTEFLQNAKAAYTGGNYGIDGGTDFGGGNTGSSGGSGINWGQLVNMVGNAKIGDQDPNSYWYTKRGGWDMLDPGYNAGRTEYGHLSTGIGDALGDAGVGVASAGASMSNPYVLLAGAAIKTVGNIINNGWGTAWNRRLLSNLDDSKRRSDAVVSNLSNAQSNDDLEKLHGYIGPSYQITKDNVGKAGVFAKGKLEDKAEELNRQQEATTDYAQRGIENAAENMDKNKFSDFFRHYWAEGGNMGTASTSLDIAEQKIGNLKTDHSFSNPEIADRLIETGNLVDAPWALNKATGKTLNENYQNVVSRGAYNKLGNIMSNQTNNLLANYADEGGFLDTNNTGAITFDFMNGLLQTKKDKQAQNSNMTNLFAGTPTGIYAIGGDLQTGGSDFSTGLSHISAGGSHEENPYDGVQLGRDKNSVPNLVEEGEVVFNDYVFSNRIPVDMTTKEKFHLPKKKEITYADLAKKLEKEISERPNDPLSQASFKAQMEQLEEQQERQKQEMEAERAKAAFEALSPEEQTALMQQKAEQEAMTQQAIQQEAMAAQQQPTPEELAMAQQTQMQADGSQAMVGQQPIMAEGGHLYADGGLKKKLYTLLGRATDSDFKSWLEEMGDGKLDYEIIKELVDKGDWESLSKNEDFIKALGKENRGLAHSISLGNNLGLFTPAEAGSFFTDPDNGNWDRQLWKGWKDSKDDAWLELVKNMKEKYPDNWQSKLEKMETPDLEKLFKDTNAYKKTTEWLKKDPENMRRYLENVMKTSTSSAAKNHALQFINEDGTWKDASKLPSYAQVFGENGKGVRETYPGTYWHSVREANRGKQNLNYLLNDDGTVELIEGTTDGLNAAGNYAWQGDKDDMAVNYYTRPVVAQKKAQDAKASEENAEDERNVMPVHRSEWPRYAGLFGPAVGLGMQALGIGKPDTSGIDAAIAAANQPANLADVKYIGDYMKYTPLDRQYYINQLEANARATDRALLNSNSPSRAAGLLANGYNTTLGLGNLARQAEEYNRAQYEKTKEFNRGTNIFNAQAYNQNQQFNAEAQNRARQYAASLGLQGAAQKLDANAGWYNGIYGNVAGLFKGIGDLGKENATRNTVADMAASGIYGTINPDNFNPNGMLRWETDKERAKRKRACGGRLKKGKRGLTF